jgi:hypothetical protein
MLNDKQLDVADDRAAEWFRAGTYQSPIKDLEHGHGHSDAVRDVVMQVLKLYPRTVEALAGRKVEVVVDGAIH